MSKPFVNPYLKVNGSRVELDTYATNHGVTLKLSPENQSDQCDDCGEDIIQSGELANFKSGYPTRVKCECGNVYVIHDSAR